MRRGAQRRRRRRQRGRGGAAAQRHAPAAAPPLAAAASAAAAKPKLAVRILGTAAGRVQVHIVDAPSLGAAAPVAAGWAVDIQPANGRWKCDVQPVEVSARVVEEGGQYAVRIDSSEREAFIRGESSALVRRAMQAACAQVVEAAEADDGGGKRRVRIARDLPRGRYSVRVGADNQ